MAALWIVPAHAMQWMTSFSEFALILRFAIFGIAGSNDATMGVTPNVALQQTALCRLRGLRPRFYLARLQLS